MRRRRTGSSERRDRSHIAYRCSKCGIGLNEQTGRKNASRRTGMSNCCRECDRKSIAAARAADPEHARALARAAYARNPETEKSRKTAWRKANPDKVRAILRKHRLAKGTEHWNTKARAWREKNPDRWAHITRSATHRRRVRMLNAPATLTANEWMEILSVFNRSCAYCLRPEVLCGRLEQEHVVPIARGGGHTADNVVPACRSCNARKRDRGPLALLNIQSARCTS